jgi:SWI/SNF-related matrix-associated actin-dependent regulator 1 of chromatin subfamily A
MLKALAIKPCVFNVVVCDESHYAKSRKALRTKALTPVVKGSKAALLITGTPALNRPIELFSQLAMLRPAYVKNYSAFAARYCNGKSTPFGYDDRGSSNEKELAWLLRKGFMVRRLKRDVLSQLPAKIRNSIWLEIKKCELGAVEKEFKRWKRLNERIYKLASGSEEQREMIFERKTVISLLYLLTAEAKIKAVVNWVVDALQQGRSFIFFAYHLNILNAVEEAVKNLNLGYIRIDGSTPSHKRTSAVECFQTDPLIRIAILSIGAAGAGITLTRVNECVFGELVWTPGEIIQAEDRIHRIGQYKKCEINYLLGTDTLDSYMFPNICKKLLTIDQITDDERTDRTLEGKKSFVEAKEEESNLMSLLNDIF